MQAEPRRHGHVLDRHHQRLALDEGERDVQVAGQPVLVGAVQVAPRRARDMSLLRRRSRSARMRSASSRHSSCAMLGTPCRSRRCPARSACPSACRARGRRRPSAPTRRTRGLLRRTYSAPTPLGPYILCAVMLARSTFIVSTSNGDLADALHRVGVEAARRVSRVILPISAIGWTRADLVVGEHDADQDRLVGDRRASRRRDRRGRPWPTAR